MHAMLVRHYLNGGAYPVGGSAVIFEAIQPIVASAGGLVVTNADVKQVKTVREKLSALKWPMKFYAPRSS